MRLPVCTLKNAGKVYFIKKANLIIVLTITSEM